MGRTRGTWPGQDVGSLSRKNNKHDFSALETPCVPVPIVIPWGKYPLFNASKKSGLVLSITCSFAVFSKENCPKESLLPRRSDELARTTTVVSPSHHRSGDIPAHTAASSNFYFLNNCSPLGANKKKKIKKRKRFSLLLLAVITA